jgi:hypothetical protein
LTNLHHKLIGNLPIEIVEKLKSMILKYHDDQTTKKFQRIEFDEEILNYLKTLIVSDMIVQKSIDGKIHIQKVFYSESGFVYPIHKDGVKCRSALNIVLQCNDDDWTRWYDDTTVLSETETQTKFSTSGFSSRDTSLSVNVIENLKFVEEFKSKVGDVYLIDVDTFHTWKCSGPNSRIVIQTKFAGFPTFDQLCHKISFDNIIIKQ